MRTPVSPDTVTLDGLERYLADNGFTREGYTKPTVDIPLPIGFTVVLPNTKNRQKAVPLHDLHHVATGYGTDIVGEAEIGAWELVAGCSTPATYVLNGLAAATGLLVSPRRVWRAWKRARGQRTLYYDEMPYDDVVKLSVGELRARLGIPDTGQADLPAKLHAAAPAREG